MRIDSLLAHLKSLEQKERDLLAEKCGTTSKYLYQIAYGNKPCRVDLAIDIDKQTSGNVSIFTLRPDVDWKYVAVRAA